jgi:hypothetical protein
MWLVLLFLVLGIIFKLHQNNVFCKHDYEIIHSMDLPDDKGRPNCRRHITLYECNKCSKIIKGVSHMCGA